MMTNAEAIKLLAACKPLVERVTAAFPGELPPNVALSTADMIALQGFEKVQSDALTAGPGLLGKLELSAGLSKVEVYKLEQLRRLAHKRHYVGTTNAATTANQLKIKP